MRAGRMKITEEQNSFTLNECPKNYFLIGFCTITME